jgi:two-component system, cell cycle sensor histidine kinase and response regulator CckA
VMPGLPGTELARRLRLRRADLKVLLLSGYSQDTIETPPPPDIIRMDKPFRPDALLRVVRRLIDGSSR